MSAPVKQVKSSSTKIYSDRRKIKHRWVSYAAVSTADSTNNAPSAVVLKANDIFTPIASGHTDAGHNPMFYDQLIQLYKYYTVIGCTATITARTAPTTDTQDSLYVKAQQHCSAMVGCHVSANSALVSQIGHYQELPQTVTVPISAQTGPETFKMSIDPNKFLGITNPLSDSRVTQEATGPPAAPVYLHLFYQPMIASNFGLDASLEYKCYWVIELDFTVVWSGPKQFAQS